MGASSLNAERYFSSGNERTHFRIDYAGEATNAGYHIRSTDTMAFIVDLMNAGTIVRGRDDMITDEIVDEHGR